MRILSGLADLVLAAHVLGEEAVLLGQRGRHLEGLASVARELPVELIERLDANDLLVAFHGFTSLVCGCCSCGVSSAPLQIGSAIQLPLTAS